MIARQNLVLKWAVVAIGLAIVAIFPMVANSHYVDLAVIIGIETMVTIGLCLLTGYTGQVSLGQAAFYGIGAYTSAILSKTVGVSPWLGMLAGAMLTGVFAYGIGLPVLRLRGNYLAMATLAIGVIMSIVFENAVALTGGHDGIQTIPRLAIGGFVFNSDRKFYYLVWIFCLAALFVSQNIVGSRTGRALRAVRDSERAAESVGVNVLQLKAKVFALSAVYASLAGSLLTHYHSTVGPGPFSFLYSLKAVVMAVVGGLASIWGAIFGTAVIQWLSDALQEFGDYQIIAFGAILVLVVMFLPRGLWVSLRDRIYQFQRKRASGGES